MSTKTTDAKTHLETTAREGKGSRISRRNRREGRVPVEIYGHGEQNKSLTVEAHALELALGTPAQVFTLVIDGKEEPCLVREVQYDTFGREVLHVDFARVDLSEEVHVDVALEIVGRAKGVAEEGGTLVVHHPSVKVVCRADAIPESIALDVSDIALGGSLHAGEITFPAGVWLDEQAMDKEIQVVGVMAPKAEEPEPEEVVEGEEGAEAPAEGEAPAAEGEGDAGEPEKKEGD